MLQKMWRKFFYNSKLNFFPIKQVKLGILFVYNEIQYGKSNKYDMEIVAKMDAVLNNYNYYLGCGYALELCRSQKKPRGQDLDFQLMDKFDLDEIITKANENGFVVKYIGYYKEKPTSVQFLYNGATVDVFLGYKNDDKWSFSTVSTNKYITSKNQENIAGWTIDRNHHLLVVTISQQQKLKTNIDGESYFLPSDLIKYCSEMYGDTWHIKNHLYNNHEFKNPNVEIIHDENSYKKIKT